MTGDSSARRGAAPGVAERPPQDPREGLRSGDGFGATRADLARWPVGESSGWRGLISEARPLGCITERAADERRQSGCVAPFAGMRVAGWQEGVRRLAVHATVEPPRRSAGLPNLGPPDAREPQLKRRGATLGLQFGVTAAR